MTEGQRFMTKVPIDFDEAMGHVRRFGFPVELAAAFVLGGWRRTAANEDELKSLLKEGQDISPVGEVTLRWPVQQQ